MCCGSCSIERLSPILVAPPFYDCGLSRTVALNPFQNTACTKYVSKIRSLGTITRARFPVNTIGENCPDFPYDGASCRHPCVAGIFFPVNDLGHPTPGQETPCFCNENATSACPDLLAVTRALPSYESQGIRTVQVCENTPKMGQKWVKKRSKKGQKRSKIKIPPFWAIFSGSSRFVGQCWCRISEKSAAPQRMARHGGTHFFQKKKRREHDPSNRELAEKMDQKEGIFILERF